MDGPCFLAFYLWSFVIPAKLMIAGKLSKSKKKKHKCHTDEPSNHSISVLWGNLLFRDFEVEHYCLYQLTKDLGTSDRTLQPKMLSDRLTTAKCQTRKYLMLPRPLYHYFFVLQIKYSISYNLL